MRGAVRLTLLRGLLLCGALAGLLAMHGLTAGHSGEQAPGTPVAAVAQHLAMPMPVGEPGSGADEGSCRGVCPQGGHALMLLCVAVLLAASGAVALLARRLRLPRRATRPPGLGRWGPLPLLRPPDPVAQLCVSRT